jgi:glutamate-1-semialdehyde 2,1-aminomutase
MKNLSKYYQFEKSLKLQTKFHELIPGGAHTYAKGDDQFPEFMPPYIVKGKGCRVWDVDGNEYIEYSNGIRSVTLGHAFEPVVQAAYKQMQNGANFVRPSTIELEYAEEFLDVLQGAEMVKFGKNGSDAVNGAVRLARAFTGRDKIGVCADHPFFSVDDWFIGTTPMSSGIPDITKSLTVKFNYNNTDSVEKMFADNPGQIACVILEPEKNTPPENHFLHKLRDICHKNGAIFILDEMITGFRAHIGGAQAKYNITPDLSTFGKAMANGFSISALAGKKELMELGGLKHDKEKVFLLSLTHGGETHAIAAARATLDFYKKNLVIEKLSLQGSKLKTGLTKVAEELQISDYFQIIGPDYCSVYTTLDVDKKHSEEFRTLFLQETIRRGLLMPSTVISYSHEDKDIEETIDIVHEALIVYKKALNEGIEKYLIGKSVQHVFRKYN